MIVNLYLLCLFIVLVSAIPVSPIIPAQTDPVYQQNDLRLQPTISRSDINPSVLQNTVQNQLQSSTNVEPFNLKQLLLNKIFSTPSLQAILDPNTKSYNLNGVKGLNSNLTPNVVNNYIVVPYDSNNVNKTSKNENNGKENGRIHSNSTNKKIQKSLTKSKSKQEPHNVNEQKPRKKDSKICNQNLLNENMWKSNQKYATKNRTRKEYVANNHRHERDSNKSTRKRKQRNDQDSQVNSKANIDLENRNLSGGNKTKAITIKPRKRQRKVNADTTTNSTQTVREKQVIPKEPTRVNVNKKPIKAQTQLKNEEPKNSQKVLQNDFLKVFPNIPQNLANTFLTGFNQFNDPQMKNYFGNYEQFYQSLLSNNPEVPERRRRKKKGRKNGRHNKRKNSQRNRKNNASSIDDNHSKMNVIDAVTPKAVFNERIQLLNTKDAIMEINPVSEDSKSFVETTLLESFTLPINNENVTNLNDEDPPEVEIKTAEIEKNDSPTAYYGWIDDYYPLFTDNEAYNANHKEVFVRNLNDDKYFYARDRFPGDIAIETHSIEDSLPEQNLKEIERNKHTYESTEEETTRDYVKQSKNEEIHFQNPPFLESPDFRTRQIDRNEINSNYDHKPNDHYDSFADRVYINNYNDKSSSFSNVKHMCADNVNGIKNQAREKSQKAVETVFAKSKVVKYGAIESEEDFKDINDKSTLSDNTMYVLAKSVSDPEDIWYKVY